MTERITINDEAFQNGIQEMDRAIEAFRPYSTQFFEQTQSELMEMRSDFTQEMNEVLNNMRDTKAPELLKSLNQYQKNVKFVYAAYAEKDEQMAKELVKL